MININLDNSNNSYLIFNNTDAFFEQIKQKIKPGDAINIAYRTYIQSIIGTGSEYKIMQISRGNEIIFSMDQIKENFRKNGISILLTSIGLFVLYFFARRKLRI